MRKFLPDKNFKIPADKEGTLVAAGNDENLSYSLRLSMNFSLSVCLSVEQLVELNGRKGNETERSHLFELLSSSHPLRLLLLL